MCFLLSLSEIEDGEVVLGSKGGNNCIVGDELRFPNRVGLFKTKSTINYYLLVIHSFVFDQIIDKNV